MYIEIQKGMYGLPQAGVLANKLLKHQLAKHRYYEVRHTSSYWRHTWRPIEFTLVIDDVGLRYKENEHALHLLQTLRKYYEAVSVDWRGTLYCGITLKWDYQQRTCELSMPGYVQQAVKNFNTGSRVLLKPLTPLIHTKQQKSMGYPGHNPLTTLPNSHPRQ